MLASKKGDFRFRKPEKEAERIIICDFRRAHLQSVSDPFAAERPNNSRERESSSQVAISKATPRIEGHPPPSFCLDLSLEQLPPPNSSYHEPRRSILLTVSHPAFFRHGTLMAPGPHPSRFRQSQGQIATGWLQPARMALRSFSGHLHASARFD